MHYAVVALEIDNSVQASNLSISDFALYDESEKTTMGDRVIQVEEFKRARDVDETDFGFYLGLAETSPWDGRLQIGVTRLRVKISLRAAPVHGVRFRLLVAGQTIEGRVQGVWPN